MADIGARSKTYTGTDVISITATVGTTLTITGEVLNPFEKSGWGGARVILRAANKAKITNTVTVKAYVSFDEGTSWDQVGAYTEFANGSGAVVPTKKDIYFAPRLRVDLVTTGSGALAADHGCVIDVEFYESDPEAKRTFTHVDLSGDTYNGDTGDSIYTSETITVDSPNKLTIVATSDDLSKITDTSSYDIETSLDASNWFVQSTLETAKPANGSGITQLTETETTDLCKYIRLKVWDDDGSAAFAPDHGTHFYLLTQE